jgi:hypothetical protein
MFAELLEHQRKNDWHFSEYRPRISQNGRCTRASVYDRLGYQEEKEPPDARSLSIIEEGRLHEESIIQQLERLNIKITDRQGWIEIPAKTHTGLIRGRIDGMLHLTQDHLSLARDLKIPVPDWVKPGIYLLEAKCISDYAFQFLGERPLPSHEDQTHLYLHKLLEEGIDSAVVIYKNRESGEWRVYWLQYDADRVTAAFKRYEQVEDYAQRGVLPPRVASDHNRYPCSRCEFKTLCWDGWEAEFETAAEGTMPAGMEEKVNRYHELKEMISPLDKEKETLKEEIKVWMLGQNISAARVNDLDVQLKKYDRKENTTPAHPELRLNVDPIKVPKAAKKNASRLSVIALRLRSSKRPAKRLSPKPTAK